MFTKFCDSLNAQFNKMINALWNRDPIAVMRHLREGMRAELGRDYEGIAALKAAIAGSARHIEDCAKSVDDAFRMVESGKRVGDLEQAGYFAQRYEENVGRLDMAKRRKEAMEERYEEAVGMLGEKRRRIEECDQTIKNHEVELNAARMFKSATETTVQVGKGRLDRFEEVSKNVQEQVDRMQAYCEVARDVRHGSGRVTAEAERNLRLEALERFDQRLSGKGTVP